MLVICKLQGCNCSAKKKRKRPYIVGIVIPKQWRLLVANFPISLILQSSFFLKGRRGRDLAVDTLAMVGVNKYLVLTLAFTLLLLRVSDAQLSVSFYSSTCPSVFDIVKSNVRSAINREKRIGASILRLLFHDCFVAVCSSNSSRPIWMSQKS